ANVQDVSRDGRVLIALGEPRGGILALAPGATREQELTLHNHSRAVSLSADGQKVLLSASDGGVYLRSTDGATAPVRLGDGAALALSPDARYVTTCQRKSGSELQVVPTGPGDPRTLPLAGIEAWCDRWGDVNSWTPDGKDVIFAGREPG